MARAPQVFSAMLLIVTLAQARVYTTQGVELSFYDNDTSCTGTPVAAHAAPQWKCTERSTAYNRLWVDNPYTWEGIGIYGSPGASSLFYCLGTTEAVCDHALRKTGGNGTTYWEQEVSVQTSVYGTQKAYCTTLYSGPHYDSASDFDRCEPAPQDAWDWDPSAHNRSFKLQLAPAPAPPPVLAAATWRETVYTTSSGEVTHAADSMKCEPVSDAFANTWGIESGSFVGYGQVFGNTFYCRAHARADCEIAVRLTSEGNLHYLDSARIVSPWNGYDAQQITDRGIAQGSCDSYLPTEHIGRRTAYDFLGHPLQNYAAAGVNLLPQGVKLEMIAAPPLSPSPALVYSEALYAGGSCTSSPVSVHTNIAGECTQLSSAHALAWGYADGLYTGLDQLPDATTFYCVSASKASCETAMATITAGNHRYLDMGDRMGYPPQVSSDGDMWPTLVDNSSINCGRSVPTTAHGQCLGGETLAAGTEYEWGLADVCTLTDCRLKITTVSAPSPPGADDGLPPWAWAAIGTSIAAVVLCGIGVCCFCKQSGGGKRGGQMTTVMAVSASASPVRRAVPVHFEHDVMAVSASAVPVRRAVHFEHDVNAVHLKL